MTASLSLKTAHTNHLDGKEALFPETSERFSKQEDPIKAHDALSEWDSIHPFEENPEVTGTY